ncbi:hypothetical protein VNO80_30091 [Phaseolus coccineus]|uniref:25S rRNA (uridine-N(3))-methyltransferase BMT5-like domain-containing protein n=1 Tax=Phaseolus coccineus TaxID=3886 RepID=A0AAN9LFK3_PHACN
MRRFDRVIFNFPHAGFHGREDSTMMIKKHKALVLGFFNNASGMLRANGEIHVSHKTTAPFSHWNIKDLAARCFLTLIESADFNIEDYPGYNNKRGDSYRCDEPFPLGKCCTYKFAYIPEAKRKRMKRKQIMFSREQINLPVQEIEYAVEQLPTSVYLSYAPRTSHYLKMKEETSIFALTNRHTSITGCHSSSMAEVHGRGAPSGGYSFGMSLVPPRTLQPMEPLQSLQMRPTSAYFRYSLTDHIPVYTRRTLQPMQPLQSSQTWQTSSHTRYPLYHPRILESDRVSLDARNEWYHQVNGGRSNYFLEEHGGTMHPAPLSHGARNEGYYHQVYGGRSNYFLEEHGGTMHNAPLSHGARNEGYYHQVYGGCSNDWQQEHCCRTTNQSASSLYGVSSEFDRFTAEVPGRNVQSELHRMNILMSEKRVFVQS